MTPQERQMVDDLFDRLTRLETAPRDPEAERAIIDGLRRAPNAMYALVQTVLVQDEALKRAEARIRELGEGERASDENPSFLDSMREAITGRRTSVPSVRANSEQPDSRWNTGSVLPNAGPASSQGGAQGAPSAAQPGQSPFGGGGSFLGTAAASAAGVIGGSLLFNSLSSMFGQRGGGSAFASTPSETKSPWDNSSSNSDLARDAGLGDVGNRGGEQQSAGLFGGDDEYNDDDNDDVGGFDGGDDFDGGDY